MKRVKLWKYIFLFCGICLALSSCGGTAGTGTKRTGMEIDGVDVSQEMEEYINHFVSLYTSDAVDSGDETGKAEPEVIIEERDFYEALPWAQPWALPLEGDNGALLIEYSDREGKLLRYQLCFYGETGNAIIDYYYCEHFVWIHRQENHYSSAVLKADYPDILYSEETNWILRGEDVYLLHDDKTLEKMDKELLEIPLPEELEQETGRAEEMGESVLLRERPALGYEREANIYMTRGEYGMAAEALRDGVDFTSNGWLADRLDYLRKNLVLVRVTRYKDKNFLQEMSYRYEYDALGNETKNLYYSKRGHIFSGWEREYGQNGELVKYAHYDQGIMEYFGEYGYALSGKTLWHERYHGEGAPEYVQTYREEWEYDENDNLTKDRRYYEDRDWTDWNEYEYDAAGNLTRQVHCYGNEDACYCEEYEYDSAGHTIKRIEHGTDGGIVWWWECEYDSAGNQTKYVLYGEDGEISNWEEWEYDSAGNQIKYTSYNGDKSIASRHEREYDHQGREIKSVGYNEAGNISWRREMSYGADRDYSKSTEYGDGGIESWWESEYDKEGNMLRNAHYRSDGSLVSCKEEEYDENGVMRKDIMYNGDGSIFYWYEYNEAGHATKELMYNSGGQTRWLQKWNEYQYDKYGNCVHIDCFDEAGSVTKQEDKTYDALGNLTSHTIVMPDSETVYTHSNKYRLMGTWQRLAKS